MSPVIDYEQCIDVFMDSLARLHGHIVEHDMHECAERDADEIATALGKLAVAKEDAFFGEESSWDESWNFIRDNMRKWWC